MTPSPGRSEMPERGGDEARQGAVGLDVDQLRIGRGVTERLHDEVGGEAEAGQILQFVARHRTGGVLRPHGGHLRLAVGIGTDALAFGQAAGTADHLLRQGIALAGIGRLLRHLEQRRGRQAQRLAGAGGQAAADNQRDAPAGPDFVQDDRSLQLRFGDHLAVLQRNNLGRRGIDLQFDLIAHFHLGDVDLDRQRAGILQRVIEDRSDLGTECNPAATLVRNEGDVLAGPPQHGVGGRLARGAGADHVANVSDEVAFLGQRLELLDRATHARLFRLDARTRILEHGQGVHRNVRTRRGVGRRRQIVGVGFAGDLEDGDLLAGRDFGTRGKPLGVGPGLDHGLGVGIALVGQRLHVVEEIENEQGLFQGFGSHGADFSIPQHIDQRLDVVAAQHGPPAVPSPWRGKSADRILHPWPLWPGTRP